MKQIFFATAALMLAALPALGAEATFERNLQVKGSVELTVANGSGYVHLTQGAGGRFTSSAACIPTGAGVTKM